MIPDKLQKLLDDCNYKEHGNFPLPEHEELFNNMTYDEAKEYWIICDFCNKPNNVMISNCWHCNKHICGVCQIKDYNDNLGKPIHNTKISEMK